MGLEKFYRNSLTASYEKQRGAINNSNIVSIKTNENGERWVKHAGVKIGEIRNSILFEGLEVSERACKAP